MDPEMVEMYSQDVVNLEQENTTLRSELERLAADRMDLDNAHALFEDCKRLDAENESRAERIDRLEESLRFYADGGNWNWEPVRYTGGQNSDGSWQEPPEETCTCERDHGDRARSALDGKKAAAPTRADRLEVLVQEARVIFGNNLVVEAHDDVMVDMRSLKWVKCVQAELGTEIPDGNLTQYWE